MMFEYVLVAGGWPAPDLPWPAFLAVVKRSARVHARAQLATFDAVRAAIVAALGGKQNAASAEESRDRLAALAYPVEAKRERAQRWAENIFAEARDDGE